MLQYALCLRNLGTKRTPTAINIILWTSFTCKGENVQYLTEMLPFQAFYQSYLRANLHLQDGDKTISYNQNLNQKEFYCCCHKQGTCLCNIKHHLHEGNSQPQTCPFKLSDNFLIREPKLYRLSFSPEHFSRTFWVFCVFITLPVRL